MSKTTSPPTLTATTLIEHRFKLVCETATPLHAGAGEPGAATDAELRRDASGRYVIPGTSIAGALRTIVERLSGVDRSGVCLQYQDSFRQGGDESDNPCGCRVCNLFGDVRPKQDPENARKRPTQASKIARASRVTVYDARFSEPRTRIIDGVGISRERRAAQDSRKFDYRQILPGSEILIEVRGEQLTEQEVQWLAAALRIVATGQVGLGGRTARGNGYLKAIENQCRVHARQLHDAGQLLRCVLSPNDADAAWGEEVAGSLAKFPGASLELSDRIVATFQMAPIESGTYLIADPVRGAASGFDAAQRTLGDRSEIPASSLAGVLRSGAERIVRTLGGFACDPTSSRRKPTEEDKRDKKRLIKDDGWCCLICRLFGNEDWASRLAVRVTSLTSSRCLPLDHVAIDRFTGGASDQKKFDALAAMGGLFSVELTIDRVKDREMAQWSIGLLALVLRDLHQGRLWIGKGGSKGHGLMQLAKTPDWQLPADWKNLRDDLPSCVDAVWKQVQSDPRSMKS